MPIGKGSYDIPGLQTPLRVIVEKRHIGKNYPGLVSITSWDKRVGDRFALLIPRVRKAIEDKLEKLVSTVTARHVLLMEIVEQNLCTIWDLAQAVNALRRDFSDLDKVEVWATPNASSGVPGTPSFYRLQDGDAVYRFLSHPERVVRVIPSSS